MRLPRRVKGWLADVRQRAAEARELYLRALSIDPESGAAASGLASLLGEGWEKPRPDAASTAAAARRALEINPDEPVALLVLADVTRDARLRQRAEVVSPVIPRAQWRPASQGGPVSPIGHGEPGRFSYLVIAVDLAVNNNGDAVHRNIVVRDPDQAGWVLHRSGDVKPREVYRYERGILVAKHLPAPVSGKSLGEIVDEWSPPSDTEPRGEPLPAGHPVRHDGRTLRYGINGAWMMDDYLTDY
jgi:tetratricopeptide (TPR) repeat protein